MTNQLSIRSIFWTTAILLAIFAISAIPANAQYYDYGYNYEVPFFGDFTPDPVPVSYYPQYNYPYTPPVYTYPITVTCYASPQSIYVGASTIWTANASGGTGSYSYSWSGDENLYGTSRTVAKTYHSAGQKRASVTVYSGGQSITQYCGNTVNVVQYYPTPTYTYPPVYPQPTYQYGYPSSNIGLDIGCYADPKNAKVNQPITWLVEVTGGRAPYIYAWTGSDGLTGTQSSVVKYYATPGEKSAIVTVTSADGRTNSRACSNQVTVSAAYRAPVKPAPVVVASPTPTPSPTPVVDVIEKNTAGAFSLAYVPWGWVAVLVILVLFATVLYLLFNREKI